MIKCIQCPKFSDFRGSCIDGKSMLSCDFNPDDDEVERWYRMEGDERCENCPHRFCMTATPGNSPMGPGV